MKKPTPRVVCAANKHNVTGLVICGARHFDNVMRAAMQVTGGFPFWMNCKQGFINQRGRWMSRKRAWIVAEAAGQIVRPLPGREGKLYSENLY